MLNEHFLRLSGAHAQALWDGVRIESALALQPVQRAEYFRVERVPGFLPQRVSLDPAMLYYVKSHTDEENSIRTGKAAGGG